jgi:hypothetical protein
VSWGTVIFALDGVLANDRRLQPANGEKVHWRERYDQRVLETLPAFQKMARLCQQLSERNAVTIISERPLAVSEVTRRWLRDRQIEFDLLHMKQDLEERPAADTKVELIKWALDDPCKPWMLFECSESVIRRVKGLGGIQGVLVDAGQNNRVGLSGF